MPDDDENDLLPLFLSAYHCTLASCDKFVSRRLTLFRCLGVVKDAVGITFAIGGGEFVEAPRFLFGRGNNRDVRVLPIVMEGIDFGC